MAKLSILWILFTRRGQSSKRQNIPYTIDSASSSSVSVSVSTYSSIQWNNIIKHPFMRQSSFFLLSGHARPSSTDGSPLSRSSIRFRWTKDKRRSTTDVLQTWFVSITDAYTFLAQNGCNTSNTVALRQIVVPAAFEQKLDRYGPQIIHGRSSVISSPDTFSQKSHIVFCEGFFAGHHLPKHNGKRIRIAGFVVRLSQTNFGCHVARWPRHFRKFISSIVIFKAIVKLFG